MVYSDAYVQHLSAGPFPGRTDPWAEIGRYFHQIHSSMMDNFAAQATPTLLEMGYIIGREASLQIAEGREPDIFIQRAMNAPLPHLRWDYELAASEALLEPGIVLEADVELDALHVRRHASGELVTVLEIISPSNKDRPELVADYKRRRERLVVEQGVNVVEIDLTLSVKRLVNSHPHAYHVAIYLPDNNPRLIIMDYGTPLKPFALPLRGEIFPLKLQPAYDHAYRQFTIAAQIHQRNDYAEAKLPFPSLLTDPQRQQALESVRQWQEHLARLRTESS